MSAGKVVVFAVVSCSAVALARQQMGKYRSPSSRTMQISESSVYMKKWLPFTLYSYVNVYDLFWLDNDIGMESNNGNRIRGVRQPKLKRSSSWYRDIEHELSFVPK